MDLRDVEDVPELCEVWWHELAARQREELVVLVEGAFLVGLSVEKDERKGG